jgi:hypothetical protein
MDVNCFTEEGDIKMYWQLVESRLHLLKGTKITTEFLKVHEAKLKSPYLPFQLQLNNTSCCFHLALDNVASSGAWEAYSYLLQI